MYMSHYLAVDLGTTGCRSILFDDKLNLISDSYREYALDTPKEKWAQQDANLWWSLTLETSKEAIAKSNVDPKTIGGISIILYGMISAIGVRNVVENRVDFTNSRNLIIAAVIMVCGLGFSGGITFYVGGTAITLTAMAIAAIAGVALNAILPGNDYEFGTSTEGDKSADLGSY